MFSNAALPNGGRLHRARLGSVTGLVLVLAGLADTAWAQVGSQSGWYHHMGYGFGHMLGWSRFGGIRMILFWIVLIAIALFLLRRFSGNWQDTSNGSSHSQTRALEILKERYARGEISKQEFEERRRTLMQ